MLPLCLSPTLSAASGFRGDEVFGFGQRAPKCVSQMKRQQGGLPLQCAPPLRAPTTASPPVEFCRRPRGTRSPATAASAPKAPAPAPQGRLGVTRPPACPGGATREDTVWRVRRSRPAVPCEFTGSRTLCHGRLWSENFSISLNLENLN